MFKLLLASYTNSLGHAGRCLNFLNKMDVDRWQCTVVGGGEYDCLFGCSVLDSWQVPYPLLGNWLKAYLPGLPFFTQEQRRQPSCPSRMIANAQYRLENLTDHWLEILDRHTPDIVIADARPELYWAARIRNIPVIGMMSLIWTPMFVAKFGLKPDNQQIADDGLLDSFNRVGTTFCQESITDCWQPIQGVGSLIPDASFFVGDNIDSNYLTIGPQLWRGPDLPVTDLLTRLDTAMPLVYITSGTSNFGIFKDVAELLADKEIQVVLSGGIRGMKECQVDSRGRLHVCSGMVPGFNFARRANLMLCHGGSQTLYQAASAGTFALVLPQHFDHQRNGLLFAAHGMAQVLPPTSSALDVACEVAARLKDNVQPVFFHSPEESYSKDSLSSFLRRFF